MSATQTRTWTILLASLLPLAAQAEIVVRGGETVDPQQEQRFFAIDRTRSGTSARQTSKSAKPLRSDSSAMADGFFRIDRNQPLQSKGPLVIRVPDKQAASDMPRVVYGGKQKQEQATPEANAKGSSPAIRSTAPGGELNQNASGPILSLFDHEANPSVSSFRETLSSGDLKTLNPTTMTHQWPIEAAATQRLSSRYGFRASPFNSNTQFHGGIDIASPIGTPVLASAAGTVTSVGNEAGYGKTITLQHPDGSESRYSHLNTDNVKPGETVRGGQMIATVGSSGHSTGAHLDYRLTKDGVSIDPLRVLGSSSTATQQPAAKQSQSRPTLAASRERIIVVQ